MDPATIALLLAIHHQLCTDCDLEKVSRPDKYRALVRHIEGLLVNTEYAYLCTHLEEAA
jgi:hypothetical protein